MCWNANVSLNTYLFSLFASILGLSNNLITFQGFLLYQSFCTMQLIEYFVWSKRFSNKILSQLAALLVLCQPLFALLLFKNYPSLKKYLPYLIITYLLFVVIFVVIWKPWSKVNFEMVKAPNGHLSWKWMKIPLTLIIVWLGFFLLPFLVTKQYLLFWYIFLTAVFSYLYFSKDLTWGSLWCWVSNFLAFALIIQVFLKDICF